MSKPPKPDADSSASPPNGVAEEAVAFEAGPESDDWTIELARIEEYRRTGVASDAEPVLEAFLARVRARGASGR